MDRGLNFFIDGSESGEVRQCDPWADSKTEDKTPEIPDTENAQYEGSVCNDGWVEGYYGCYGTEYGHNVGCRCRVFHTSSGDL